MQQSVKISEIIDTVTEVSKGEGILGFVVTLPEGGIINHVRHYTKRNHQQVLQQISRFHKKTQRSYFGSSGA